MPTVINNPGNTESSGTNLVTGVVVMIAILAAVVLFFLYGLPMIQNSYDPTPTNSDINVNVEPTTPTTTPVIPSTPTNTTTPTTQTP